MKRTLISVFIVLLFTAFFVLVFRYTGSASSISSDDLFESETEAPSGIIPPSTVLTPPFTKEAEESTEAENAEAEEEGENEFEIKEYIREKIVPVMVGIITSVTMILIALKPIISAFKALKEVCSGFSKKDKERNESFEKRDMEMLEHMRALEEETAKIPALEKEIKTLIEINGALAEAVVLGFTSNADVVRSGRGKKMSLLLKKVKAGGVAPSLQEEGEDVPGGDKV